MAGRSIDPCAGAQTVWPCAVTVRIAECISEGRGAQSETRFLQVSTWKKEMNKRSAGILSAVAASFIMAESDPGGGVYKRELLYLGDTPVEAVQ
jgi:hypothetical protein